MWPLLWLRFLEWLHDKPEPAPLPAFNQADLDAIVEMNAPPKEGWYAWECTQYRSSGAFWFDPRRYDGSSLAFHRPSADDLVRNYDGSMAEAVVKYGRAEVDAATWFVCQKARQADGVDWDAHRDTLDPIGWCVQMYRAYGSPRIKNIPANWSMRAVPEPTNAWLPGEYSAHLNQIAFAQQNAARSARLANAAHNTR